MIEMFGGGEGVPDAWLGLYSWLCIVNAAALFGQKTEEAKEEGYRALECALEHIAKWESFKENDLLDVGNGQVFGGVQLIKGKSILLLPDGTKEGIAYNYRLESNAEDIYYILTASSGWEWYNSVRNEERFQEIVERARILKNKE